MKGYFVVDRDNTHTKFLKSKLVYSKELLDFMNIEYNFVTEMCEIINDGKNINSLGTRNNYLFVSKRIASKLKKEFPSLLFLPINCKSISRFDFRDINYDEIIESNCDIVASLNGLSFASRTLKTILAIVINILIFTILFTTVPVLNIDFGIVINLILALLIMYVSRVYFSISPFKYKQAYIHTRLDKSNNVLHINASRKFGKKLFEINNTVCNDYFVRNYFQCVTGNSFQEKYMFDKYSLYEIVPNEISDYNEGSAIFDVGKVPYKGEIYYDVSLLNKYGILYDEDGIDNKYFKVSVKNKGHIKYIYDYYGDIQLKNLYPVELLVDSTDLGDVFVIEESTKYLVFKNRLDDGNEWIKSYYTLNNDDADVNYEAMKKVWTKKYIPTELFNSMFFNFTCCILMLVFALLYVNNSISGAESFTIAEKMLSNIIDTTGFIPKVIILCISAIIGEVIVTYIKPSLFYKMSCILQPKIATFSI